jgi:hypothetical protein
MLMEKCKLCLQQKELQNSHLMPRALYLKSRDSGKTGNQDPYVVTAQGSKQSSFQTKEYVLCRECEQRFSKNGEEYVMRLVTKQNGRFPLLEKLKNAAARTSGWDWTHYSATDTPNIDREKIAYFALSVLWRASVHTWKQENGSLTSIDLGAKYNEQIRRYLLDQTPIPQNAYLTVVACTDSESQNNFFVPGRNFKKKDHSVGFTARGLMFFLLMSKTAPGWQQRLSMTNNERGWIASYDCSKHAMWKLRP